MSSLSKLANYGNNPGELVHTNHHSHFECLLSPCVVWPLTDKASGVYNAVGIATAIVALYEFHTRREVLNIVESKEHHKSARANTSIASTYAFIPLASLLFGLHRFLTDSGTIISWSWTGYPISGPVPYLHGTMTLVAHAAGAVLSLSASPRFLSHPIWFCFGAASTFIMYSLKDWPGYAGGLGLTIFLASIIPPVFQNAAGPTRMARTYFTAFLLVVLLYLADVWTVAYAFVPGGVYLRERTDM